MITGAPVLEKEVSPMTDIRRANYRFPYSQGLSYNHRDARSQDILDKFRKRNEQLYQWAAVACDDLRQREEEIARPKQQDTEPDQAARPSYDLITKRQMLRPYLDNAIRAVKQHMQYSRAHARWFGKESNEPAIRNRISMIICDTTISLEDIMNN